MKQVIVDIIWVSMLAFLIWALVYLTGPKIHLTVYDTDWQLVTKMECEKVIFFPDQVQCDNTDGLTMAPQDYYTLSIK